MNRTHVKWNTEKPKFEDVEGKDALIKHAHGGASLLESINQVLFDRYFRDSFIAYAILSDEQPEREQVIVEVLTANENEAIKECMVFADDFDYSEIKQSLIDIYGGRNVCLSSIEIGHVPENIKRYIDVLKPMKLMGIEPTIEESSDECRLNPPITYRYLWIYGDFEISTAWFSDKKSAIESWNSLVLKLTGETK